MEVCRVLRNYHGMAVLIDRERFGDFGTSIDIHVLRDAIRSRRTFFNRSSPKMSGVSRYILALLPYCLILAAYRQIAWAFFLRSVVRHLLIELPSTIEVSLTTLDVYRFVSPKPANKGYSRNAPPAERNLGADFHLQTYHHIHSDLRLQTFQICLATVSRRILA